MVEEIDLSTPEAKRKRREELVKEAHENMNNIIIIIMLAATLGVLAGWLLYHSTPIRLLIGQISFEEFISASATDIYLFGGIACVVIAIALLWHYLPYLLFMKKGHEFATGLINFSLEQPKEKGGKTL